MEPHPNNRPPTHKNPKPNKDLLRLEDRIFGLIDDHPVEPKEKAVKKMLTEKPKPQIGEFKESALLKQVKNFLPMIHRENAKLLNQTQPLQKLDVHFSNDNEGELQPRQEKETMEEEEVHFEGKHIEMNLLLVPQMEEQEQTANTPLKIIEELN